MNTETDLQHMMSVFPNGINLMAGSHVTGGTDLDVGLRYWIDHRHGITKAIHRPGTLLDIGCANGFLLACLMFWSEYEITPFGIDMDLEAVLAAQNLLPDFPGHFAQRSLEQLHLDSGFEVQRFDFVFWNVWDGLDFDDTTNLRFAQNTFAAARGGGRVILGFYDLCQTTVERQLGQLVAVFGHYLSRIETGVVFAWWDVE